MASTVKDGFSQLLDRLTPSAAARSAASSHRTSIEAKLEARFGLYRMFESGSWAHGTGVATRSDVDYFVSLKSLKPALGTSILTAVRDAMKERFPNTNVHVSRPAVVLEFGAGYERVELIPAYFDLDLGDSEFRYDIPGVLTDWMESTPKAHLKYVNDSNARDGVKGGAKGLARLTKAWKYYCNVPISSFYLEMRAAEYMNSESSVLRSVDQLRFFRYLQSKALAAMNDPNGATGRIHPCSSNTTYLDALSKLNTATSRAQKAFDLDRAGKTADAFTYWDLVFGGKFPAYY